MNLISISPATLRSALQHWEAQARDGSWPRDTAKPIDEVASEGAGHLWGLLTAADLGLPALGFGYEGGYFAGLIHQDDGLYGLVAAPKGLGEFTAPWHTANTDVSGASSLHDGAANTRAMAETGSGLAQRALGLQINGFADWYVPARDELELCYRAFKPTRSNNWTDRGDNPSSQHIGRAYQPQAPMQTAVPAFAAGGPEAFDTTWYWSSTQSSRHGAWYQYFGGGYVYDGGKGYKGRVRAFRRFKVQ